MCQPIAYRVASISEIEDRICKRTTSESIRESLTRRMSALSASSLANLATGVGGLRSIRQHIYEKKSKERQTDKEIQKEEKQAIEMEQQMDKQKQAIEVERECEERGKK